MCLRYVFISACWHGIARSAPKISGYLSFLFLSAVFKEGCCVRVEPDRAAEAGLSSSRQTKGAGSGSFLESAFSCPSSLVETIHSAPEKMVHCRLKNEYLPARSERKWGAGRGKKKIEKIPTRRPDHLRPPLSNKTSYENLFASLSRPAPRYFER